MRFGSWMILLAATALVAGTGACLALGNAGAADNQGGRSRHQSCDPSFENPDTAVADIGDGMENVMVGSIEAYGGAHS